MYLDEKISRKDLLQASSTVLAGALIFLTLGSELGLEIGFLFMVAIYTLIIAIGVLLSPEISFGSKTPDSTKMLKRGGGLFVFGLAILFAVITLAIMNSSLKIF